MVRLSLSPENQKKYEYATDHFKRLNQWLSKEGSTVRYQLNFLTQRDYNKFFQKIRDNDLRGFRSELDVVLERRNGSQVNASV